MAKWTLDCIASDMEEVDRIIDDVCDSGNAKLSEMCHYILDNHGKRVRPATLILAFRALGGRDIGRALDIASALEVAHNATLIHDDINDRGDLRRGARALYLQYSINRSIVAGDYLFTMAFKLIGTSHSRLLDFLLAAAAGLASGEFDQGDYERNHAVTEADYIKIVRKKTAGLFEVAAKAGAFTADPENDEMIEAFGEFGINAGIAFQIVDDILDEIGDPETTGKRIGNDIVDGKPTLPIIYAMQDPTVGARVREIFTDPEADYDAADEAISLILGTDSIPRCRRLAEEYAEKARMCLRNVPRSEYLDTLLSMLDFFVSRDR